MERNRPNIPDIVYQNELSECGLACVCMATQFMAKAPTLFELRERFPVSLHGASMLDLINILSEYGKEALPVEFDVEQINMLPTPAILHYGKNHFIYLAYCKGNYAYVLDPAIGSRLISTKILTKHVSKYAILCGRTADDWVSSVEQIQPSKLSKIIHSLKNTIRKSDKQLLTLSLLSAFGAFLIPIFISTALDNLLPNQQNNSIWFLAVTFLLAILTSSLLEYFSKRLLVMRTVAHSTQELSATFFNLLRNTLSFFERRETGDIAARYSAYERAQLRNVSINNESLISAVILIVAMTAMFLVNPLLTLLSLITIIAYGCASIYYQGQRVMLTQELEKAASLKTELLYESIQGIIALKTGTLLPQRSITFSSRLKRALSAWKQNYLNEAQQRVIYSIISSVELIFMIAISLPLLHQGKLTFGLFYAFTFFRQIALGSATGFFLIQLQRKENEVAVTRAQDMIQSTKDKQYQKKSDFDVEVSINGLSYRYDKYPVLNDITLTLTPGKKIAIIGKSGSGKSTLLKLITGLITPKQGKLFSERIELEWSWLAERSFIVTQDDILFHTSLKNNVSLFDQDISSAHCSNQLEKLGLSQLIKQFPTGVDTIISENNCPLSVGQKKRIMIARALVQKKPIVLLDEPTANLDTESSKLAMDAILHSDKTAIVVTHESQHLNQFDEVYCIEQGRLVGFSFQQVA